jgi:hypothetical protein
VSYSRGTDNTEKHFYSCVTQTTQKTSHVTDKYCLSGKHLRLRGSVFNEPLPRSRLKNPVVPLLVKYYLEIAISVAQPFLHKENTPQQCISSIIIIILIIIIIIIMALQPFVST